MIIDKVADDLGIFEMPQMLNLEPEMSPRRQTPSPTFSSKPKLTVSSLDLFSIIR